LKGKNTVSIHNQTENDDDIFAHQVRRMSRMRGYPTGDDGEWIAIARKYAANSTLALAEAVSRLIEDAKTFPSCAELREAIVSRLPAQEPSWARRPAPAADAEAWKRFAAGNELVMSNARAKEAADRLKNEQVRKYLHIGNFMDVGFPQRWWAEGQLGYQLSHTRHAEAEEWYLALAPGADPRVVVRPGQRSGESLADMGFARKGQQ
jgi:hypothetical protein